MSCMRTKQKPAIHLKNNDQIVFRNSTSNKFNIYKVSGVKIDEERSYLPVRVFVATPEPFDKKATAEVAFTYRENVLIVDKGKK